MEMEDNQQHQYGMPDLRQLLNGRPIHFQAITQGPDLFSSGNRHVPPPQQPQHHHHFDMIQMVCGQVGHELMPRGLYHQFLSDATTANNATTTTAIAAVTSASLPSDICGFDSEATAFGGDGGNGRWPRQETLALLEIRSRLDPKFKEANQKGPLWDKVSRIMSEEHGYQRSGKKCREKFENLYKYYKKTKEGKARRQDGKHYRFFRQLEALYGETSNSVSGKENHLVANNFRFHGAPNSNTLANQEVYHTHQKLCQSLSHSNSSEFDTSSSEDNDLSTAAAAMEHDSKMKKKKGGSSSSGWKAKVKEFVDSQMRKLMERQEAWLEKLKKTLEQKEEEMVLREEQWRKEEAARIDREHKFWAKERVRTEARNAALMEALQNLTGKQLKGGTTSSEELIIMTTGMEDPCENQNENNIVNADGWQESEISRLIQLRTSMESRFERGCSEEILWEEIAAKMACLGFDRNSLICKNKWDSIATYLMKTKESNKKPEENSRACVYYQNNESLHIQGRAYREIIKQGPETVRPQSNDGFLMADGEDMWENHGLKLNKGKGPIS